MRPESYAKLGIQLVVLVGAMAIVAAFGLNPPPKSQAPAPPPAIKATPTTRPKPRPIAVTRPAPAAPKYVLDREALARVEADLTSAEAAAKDAEQQVAEAAQRLESASSKAAAARLGQVSLASSIKDPRPRLLAARQKGELLVAERDKLQGELQALSEAPRPRRKILIDKSPVAKKADGEEFHFEIHGDRVAFIDLERLLDKVKTDARVQIRLSGGNRPAVGTVGPVGAFEMSYEVGRLDDGANPRMGNFGLSAWEILPTHASRGETYEAAVGAASDFARAIRRLNPARDVITLWVYPDGFPLYRRLRETLHQQGFLVAARPLPEGMTIRGSPSGSASSAQ